MYVLSIRTMKYIVFSIDIPMIIQILIIHIYMDKTTHSEKRRFVDSQSYTHSFSYSYSRSRSRSYSHGVGVASD